MQALINKSVKISPELHSRIKNLADLRKQSVHSVMVQALEAYLTREEKREAWRKEGIEAWEEYQKTGLHLTNAEVVDWMDKIIAGENAPMPKCHI